MYKKRKFPSRIFFPPFFGFWKLLEKAILKEWARSYVAFLIPSNINRAYPLRPRMYGSWWRRSVNYHQSAQILVFLPPKCTNFGFFTTKVYEFWFFLRKCTNIGASTDVPDVPRRTSVPVLQDNQLVATGGKERDDKRYFHEFKF